MVILLVFWSSIGLAQDFVQKGEITLTPPTIAASEVFFQDSTTISVSHPMPEAEVLCFLPVLGDSTIHVSPPMKISEPTCISCFAKHEDFKTSSFTQLNVRRGSRGDISVDSNSSEPSDQYPGDALNSLVDGKKGASDFHEIWLGYDVPEVIFDLKLDSTIKYSHVVISTLSDHGSWIFEPSRIEVLVGQTVIAELDIPPAASSQKPAADFYDLNFDPVQTNELSIRIKTTSTLPEWHAGSGSQGWLFIDEIVVN